MDNCRLQAQATIESGFRRCEFSWSSPLGGAGYLAFIALSGGAVAGCGPGSGCNQVLSSRWAYWLGIISLPAPLDSACNPLIVKTSWANLNACEYARLSLALWRIRPAAYREFDDYLFDSNPLPLLEEARAKAEALVGKTALDAGLREAWVGHQIETDVDLYMANSSTLHDARLPQLMFGDVTMRGTVETADELARLIEQHTPLGKSGIGGTN